jgi:lactoylglutathione lyase
MVENVIHTSLWVADMDRTESFYVDALGLSRTREHSGSTYQEDVRNVFLAGPDGTELQFKSAPGREPEAPAGFDHVAVSTTDIDAEFERIVSETGCPVILEPTTIGTGERIAFVEDPDGYAVELIQLDDE